MCTYLHVEHEGLGFMSYLKLYSCVYLGPRADMYLLSLSTLALLKCLLSLSFSPLSVFSMDAHMYVFGGGFGLEA